MTHIYSYFRNANECNGNICTWQVSDKLKKKGAEIDMCYWIPEDSLPAPQVVGLVFNGHIICNMIDTQQEGLASNHESKNEMKILTILVFIAVIMLL